MESTISLTFWCSLELILILLLWFLLWNINDYLANKPPNQQTLLDGAYSHLFEYIGWLNTLLSAINSSYDVSNHRVNPDLAFILAALFLWILQLFCYQLLICAIIRLGIVLHLELPSNWSDEFVHQRIRMALTMFSIPICVLISIHFDFQLPFAMVLQGKKILNLRIRFGPIIGGLAFLVQLVARIIGK